MALRKLNERRDGWGSERQKRSGGAELPLMQGNGPALKTGFVVQVSLEKSEGDSFLVQCLRKSCAT